MRFVHIITPWKHVEMELLKFKIIAMTRRRQYEIMLWYDEIPVFNPALSLSVHDYSSKIQRCGLLDFFLMTVQGSLHIHLQQIATFYY